MAVAEKTVRVVIGGRVQGVGYRAFVQAEAKARGVAGFVRNCANGDVEAVFSGGEGAVEALCAACRRGPAAARVERVEIIDAPADAGALQGFEVRF